MPPGGQRHTLVFHLRSHFSNIKYIFALVRRTKIEARRKTFPSLIALRSSHSPREDPLLSAYPGPPSARLPRLRPWRSPSSRYRVSAFATVFPCIEVPG